MTRRPVRVTPGEMDLLSMLWAEGPLTLGEAHRRFTPYGREVSYPTMQTRLNRLVEKRLVARSDDRPAEYRAVATRDQVSLGHLQELLAKISRGDAVPLVAQLLREQKLTQEQLAELEQLLADARRVAQSPAKRRK
ncbi:MAG: BlaI/MecI/CopY family transcriptional regulator [Planctomycetaceae bacterium]|nr:BlaI/MecI/CopY family transcriptional regulator [Planctomycetaceae bacterium]